MQATDKTSAEVVHRLLFRALVELRAQGHELKDKLVFHLADLFHTVVLDLEAAAEGRLTYDDVLSQLEEKAKEKNCERWLSAARAEVEGAPAPASGA